MYYYQKYKLNSFYIYIEKPDSKNIKLSFHKNFNYGYFECDYDGNYYFNTTPYKINKPIDGVFKIISTGISASLDFYEFSQLSFRYNYNSLPSNLNIILNTLALNKDELAYFNQKISIKDENNDIHDCKSGSSCLFLFKPKKNYEIFIEFSKNSIGYEIKYFQSNIETISFGKKYLNYSSYNYFKIDYKKPQNLI